MHYQKIKISYWRKSIRRCIYDIGSYFWGYYAVQETSKYKIKDELWRHYLFLFPPPKLCHNAKNYSEPLFRPLKKLLNKETSQSDSLRNTDLFFINFCLIFILTMLNKANIKPIYKKDDPFDKTNYKPTSTLQISSKAF